MFTCGLIKQAIQGAYASANQETMTEKFTGIIDWCRVAKNVRFLWLARLIEIHFDCIVGYGGHQNSSGRIEGIIVHIKIIRRKAYDLPDDDYFFLRSWSHQDIRTRGSNEDSAVTVGPRRYSHGPAKGTDARRAKEHQRRSWQRATEAVRKGLIPQNKEMTTILFEIGA